LLSLAAAPSSSAYPEFGSGCLVKSTPFYQRLIGAGIFEPEKIAPTGEEKPLQLLFRIARFIPYDPDHNKEDIWQSADETSKIFSGDCEDKAIWLYTQLRRNGYSDVHLVIGKYGPSSTKFHVWVTYVDETGVNWLLDPTMQRKPWNIDAFPKNLYR